MVTHEMCSLETPRIRFPSSPHSPPVRPQEACKRQRRAVEPGTSAWGPAGEQAAWLDMLIRSNVAVDGWMKEMERSITYINQS